MKNVIFYKSNTGFTKEYVDLLARRVIPLDIYKINKINRKIVEEADNIFYAGPIRNNVVVGLSKFLNKYKYMEKKNIYILAVGIQIPDNEKRDLVITANALDSYHVRLYLLNGGMDLSRMKFPQKQMLIFGLKAAAKKEGGAQGEAMLQMLKNPINRVSESSLDVIVDVYRRVNLSK